MKRNKTTRGFLVGRRWKGRGEGEGVERAGGGCGRRSGGGERRGLLEKLVDS